MSCYLRHLKDVFAEASIELLPEERKEADRMIHEMLGVGYKDCPHTWAQVKVRLNEDRDAFINELRQCWDAGSRKD